jgi:ABC-type transporter lipoprotein component MlaA
MNTREQPRERQSIRSLGICLLALALAAGCARTPGVPGPDGMAHGASFVEAADVDIADDAPDYDPWQPFNEAMFSFNHDVLDRFLVKPAATGWELVVPQPARKASRAFDNMECRGAVNNILSSAGGAGRESRVSSSTTVGLRASHVAEISASKGDADTGQTFALYGVAAGPYLVLPTMPPLTVRDAIGHGIDGALGPSGPSFRSSPTKWKSIMTAVNERSLNLKLYADVEESVATSAAPHLTCSAVGWSSGAQCRSDAELALLFGNLKPAEPAIAVATPRIMAVELPANLFRRCARPALRSVSAAVVSATSVASTRPRVVRGVSLEVRGAGSDPSV